VDSGSKALELLGLRDNGAEDASSPSSSSPDHQVRENPSPLGFSISFLAARIGTHPVLFWPVTNQPHQPLSLFLLQEIDVNLIITDYCMPGMTGYDLLKRVKVRGLKLNSFPLFGRSLIILMVHETTNHRGVEISSLLANSGMQGSSSLKDIPVVIMSSENVPARISR
jgi:two-component response regulator (ARR-A family)